MSAFQIVGGIHYLPQKRMRFVSAKVIQYVGGKRIILSCCFAFHAIILQRYDFLLRNERFSLAFLWEIIFFIYDLGLGYHLFLSRRDQNESFYCEIHRCTCKIGKKSQAEDTQHLHGKHGIQRHLSGVRMKEAHCWLKSIRHPLMRTGEKGIVQPIRNNKDYYDANISGNIGFLQKTNIKH